MRRCLPVLLALACLAGCGGSHHKLALSHPCDPSDYFMNCVQQPAPKALAAPHALASGIDFAWSCPSPAGHQFGASYLSFDASKNWTRSCVNQWHRAGAGTIFVWETSSTRALSGRQGGQADARAALGQALALGLPGGRPIFFAVDFDETAGQAAGVASYFRGVHDVLENAGPASFPTPVPVGAYGGYWAIKRLFDAHLIGYGWQTYAWSGGLWDPRAQLEQYLNAPAVDYDRAIAHDYGQSPFSSAYPLCLTHRIAPGQCAAAKAKIASDGRAAASSRRAYAARGCPVLAQRIGWFSGRLRSQPRARAARRRGALAASRRAYARQSCGVFAQRASWFTAAAARERAAN